MKLSIVDIDQNVARAGNNDLVYRQCFDYLIKGYYSIICRWDVSEKSVDRYLYDAESFISFMYDYGFDSDILRAYKTFMDKTSGLSANSQKGRLNVAKRLVRHLFDKGLTKENYSAGVKGIPVDTAHKKAGLNFVEVSKIEEYFQLIDTVKSIEVERKGKTFTKTIPTNKIRNKLLFYLMAYQGLRSFEVCNLELNDINLNDKTAKVLGKHMKDKKPFDLNEKVIPVVRQWIRTRKSDSKYLIPNRSGKQMSTSTIRHIFTDSRTLKETGEVVGILPKLGLKRTVHGFRHFFITQLLDKFEDISIVMSFARLRTLETVKVYDDRRKIKANLKEFNTIFQ